MARAIEITTFELSECSCEDFIRANADVDEWLRRQPGFQSRDIAQHDDGSIIDMLIWDSVEEGTDAMERIMIELSDSPVHAMIDQRTVSWNIAPVRHEMQASAAGRKRGNK
jgi:hypothetical protein